MSKQYTVKLSERQRFDVYMFVAATVQPKDRKDARLLKGVFETFGLDEIQERGDSLADGEKFTRKDCSDEAKPIESGSVDLNTLLDYLDKPGATAVGALLILDVSDELQRAKDGRGLESVPAEDKGA
jgi:hypothetical protein